MSARYCVKGFFLPLIIRIYMHISVVAVEPSFRVPEINVTVVEGETAVLPCSVLSLSNYKVLWTTADTFILTLEDRRIIDDDRFSVERPFIKDWNLHIRKVTYNDTGKYICQINTTPVKTKVISLTVHVPPRIIEEYSSGDVSVREREKVTLTCNATGVPPPEITWYKILNGLSNQDRARQQIGTPGEVLLIHNVTRECGGIYECEAFNGIEPAVARQMKVEVLFAPEVRVSSKRLGQYPGRETFLECDITANPHGFMYWEKDGVQLTMLNQEKYFVDLYTADIPDTKILSLRIKELTADDFGTYTCVSKNSHGDDRESMVLYDYSNKEPKSTTRSSEVQVIPTRLPSSKVNVDIPGLNSIPINKNKMRPLQPNGQNSMLPDRQNVGALGSDSAAPVDRLSFCLTICWLLFHIYYESSVI
ncbi:hypothetical protein CHS0354_017643 [Potamilus streckersoni]|uniref:Ig-like domain-containing protein n=1 Tax=Potamilus streckersoni TaxID=2493646 RepID=A0AAE0W5X2_9BIVA|nr:hypothetical protein CHS0354_017643 [Potamilus streckersoni]